MTGIRKAKREEGMRGQDNWKKRGNMRRRRRTQKGLFTITDITVRRTLGL